MYFINMFFISWIVITFFLHTSDSAKNKQTNYFDYDDAETFLQNKNDSGHSGFGDELLARFARQAEELTSTVKAAEDKPAATVAPVATSANQIGRSTMRPTAGLLCSTDLFRRMDRCCPIPTLIGLSDIERCVKRNRKRREAQFYNARRTHIILYNGRVLNGGGRQSWVTRSRTDPGQVCLVDCVFRNLKWISDDWTMNSRLMFSTMEALVPPTWSSLVNMSRTDCASLLDASRAFATMRHPSGVQCLQVPTKMMRCIKRTFMLNCPFPISSGPQCMDDMDHLQSCDIHTI
ncbi:hypothetical protein B566_EDAN010721 [Ephemera danica]|nr:hypothetical protein B566_EDAN010721 [Ephemera danica]